VLGAEEPEALGLGATVLMTSGRWWPRLALLWARLRLPRRATVSPRRGTRQRAEGRRHRAVSREAASQGSKALAAAVWGGGGGGIPIAAVGTGRRSATRPYKAAADAARGPILPRGHPWRSSHGGDTVAIERPAPRVAGVWHKGRWGISLGGAHEAGG
jgi:hypothetical protein